MFYPRHHMWTYCTYLGSVIIKDHKYDLGVYEQESGVSNATVYGDDDSEYLSGPLYFNGKPFNNEVPLDTIVRLLYENK